MSIERLRPRVNLAVPSSWATNCSAEGIGIRLDDLVAAIHLDLDTLEPPETQPIQTTVANDTRLKLAKMAKILGVKPGAMAWLLDALSPSVIESLCKARAAPKRKPKKARRSKKME